MGFYTPLLCILLPGVVKYGGGLHAVKYNKRIWVVIFYIANEGVNFLNILKLTTATVRRKA